MQLGRKEQIALGLVALIVLIFVGTMWFYNRERTLIPVVEAASLMGVTKSDATMGMNAASSASLPVTEAEKVAKTITVYIVGAVLNPGIYELSEGSRLHTAVSLAGGFAKDADQEAANLAMVLSDGARYRLPFLDEDNSIPLVTLAEDGVNTPGFKVNINTADKSTLETLPQIGAARAQAIIDYRNRNGLFAGIEEIKKVPGIGSGIFELLRDLIVV